MSERGAIKVLPTDTGMVCLYSQLAPDCRARAQSLKHETVGRGQTDRLKR